MTTVRLKGNRVVFPSGGKQNTACNKINQRRSGRNGKAGAGLFYMPGIDEPAGGRKAYAGCGDEDQRSFGAAREILRLVMPLGMLFIGRPGGYGQHRQREAGSKKIYQRFRRIRKQADRSGKNIRDYLQSHCGD